MTGTMHALYQQYTSKHQARAVEALRRLHQRSFPHLTLRIVIVDNAVTTPTTAREQPDVTLIDGDNGDRECSGWDRGWRWITDDASPSDDDVVCLCNETFMDDPEAQDFFAIDPLAARQSLASDALLGHVDGLGIPVSVFGIRMRHWIKCNLVLMNARVMRTLMPLTLPFGNEELFVDDPQEFFRRRTDLSAEYTAFLRGFLQGEPNVALWRWHSACPFDRENLAGFRLKARAIMSEHALSGRAIRSGYPLVDLSRPRWPSKEMRHRLRRLLYETGAWRLIPRLRSRFSTGNSR